MEGKQKVKILDEIIKFGLNPRKYLYKKKLQRKLKNNPELIAKVLEGEEIVMPPSIPAKVLDWAGNNALNMIPLIFGIGILMVTGLFVWQTLEMPLNGVPGQNESMYNQSAFGNATTVGEAFDSVLPFGQLFVIFIFIIMCFGALRIAVRSLNYGI